ncbi:hypothetical protein [Parashewanella tropica]|uniref:hypothetical protein n=1 Tax=Parashewanella tropica TaxID=2547970 RepID=UPI0010592D3E|nr:hypothetical protein [Parashewanella tropica]
MKSIYVVTSIVCLLLVSACNDKNSGHSIPNQAKVMFDEGYIQNANVCTDCNGNLNCDSDEPLTTTDEAGSFNPRHLYNDNNQHCPLLADITTNAIIQNANKPVEKPVKLITPQKCYNISLLTTLLPHYMAFGDSREEAEEKIKAKVLSDADLCSDHIEMSRTARSPLAKREADHLRDVTQRTLAALLKEHEQIEQNENADKMSHSEKRLVAIQHILTHENLAQIETPIAQNQPQSSSGTGSSSNTAQSRNQHEESLILQAMRKATFVNMKQQFQSSQDGSQVKLTTYQPSKSGLVSHLEQVISGDVITMEFSINSNLDTFERPLYNDSNRPIIYSNNGVGSANDYFFQSGIRPSDENDSPFLRYLQDVDKNNALLFTNASQSGFKKLLLGKQFPVKNRQISSLMHLFPNLASWESALVPTQNYPRLFPNNDEMIAFTTRAFIPLDTMVLANDTSCRNGGNPEDICNYVQVYQPSNRSNTSTQKTSAKLENKLTSPSFVATDGNFDANSGHYNYMPDMLVIHADGDKKIVALLEYQPPEDINEAELAAEAVAEVSGPKTTINFFEISAGEEFTFSFKNNELQIFSTGDSNNELPAKKIGTGYWSSSKYYNQEAIEIGIPYSVSRVVPSLYRRMIFTKINGFYRSGEFLAEGSFPDGRQLSTGNKTDEQIRLSVNRDQVR